MLDISLNSEGIFNLWGLTITNSVMTTLLVTLLLVIISVKFSYARKRYPHSFFVKSVRVLCFELIKFTDDITEDRKLTKIILPLLLTFFIFIITANLLALTPGFLGSFYGVVEGQKVPLLRSPNSDINTTLALALLSIGAIQVISFNILGANKYMKRFINFTSPTNFILGFFELISEGLKIFSFAFRLFGNVFAGEVLLLVVAFLIPYILPIPFMLMEVFVGFIQAFIFTMLTLTFVKTAIIKHR